MFICFLKQVLYNSDTGMQIYAKWVIIFRTIWNQNLDDILPKKMYKKLDGQINESAILLCCSLWSCPELASSFSKSNFWAIWSHSLTDNRFQRPLDFLVVTCTVKTSSRSSSSEEMCLDVDASRQLLAFTFWWEFSSFSRVIFCRTCLTMTTIPMSRFSSFSSTWRHVEAEVKATVM